MLVKALNKADNMSSHLESALFDSRLEDLLSEVDQDDHQTILSREFQVLNQHGMILKLRAQISTLKAEKEEIQEELSHYKKHFSFCRICGDPHRVGSLGNVCHDCLERRGS